MFWRFVSFDSRGTATLVTAIITVVIAVATLTPLPTAIDAPGSDKLHHFLAFVPLSGCLSLVVILWIEHTIIQRAQTI